MATGITKRHGRSCKSRNGGRCNCEPTFEAWVFSKREDKKIRKTFAREAEAKSWRTDALAALSRGGLRSPKPITVRQAWEAWREGAERAPSSTVRATPTSHRPGAHMRKRCGCEYCRRSARFGLPTWSAGTFRRWSIDCWQRA